jgi:hypothetical protein
MCFILGSYKALKQGEKPLIATFASSKHAI